MVVEISGRDADHLFEEMLWKMRVHGVKQESRNGVVLSVPSPVMLTLRNPTHRVLFNAKRNANPFFHVMEFAWMMAGRRDVAFLEFYNKQMREYADPDGFLNAAYGYRWGEHWGFDQLTFAAARLAEDPTTRQAVVTMWDPAKDTDNHNDKACNTHCYFRVVDEYLNMLVCNRSNDAVWGALGANIVHLTYMHEYVASVADIKLGTYQVISNNFHIYEKHWNLLTDIGEREEWYPEPLPLLTTGEVAEELVEDCLILCEGGNHVGTAWAKGVARPIKAAWDLYKNDDPSSALDMCQRIVADDWRKACHDWLTRKYGLPEMQQASNGTTPKEHLNQTR